MAYPLEIDQFPAKLNKKTDGSVYVMEEELSIAAGKYEGLLDHDNITNNSIRVYTGSKLTGQEIINYIISVPSETPWRRHIKVFADVAKVYVTYETPGDTVEADDVNGLQQSMTATQQEVERYKAANDEAVAQIDNRLTAHTANRQNPHGVTVTQIGAETPAGAQAKADTAKTAAISAAAQDATAKANTAQANAIAAAALDATSKANAVQANVNSHTANKNNPHSVTVTQIGAETPAGAQAKADAAKNSAISTAASDAASKANTVQGNLNTHTANANDAHDVANRLQALKTALTNYIDQSIAAIVDGAPEMLDTLYELANALGNDSNFSATMTGLIGQKLNSSEVVTTAAANKVLRLNASGVLPASISGTAAAVPWTGVTGKPGTYAPGSHGHNAAEITQSADYRFVTDVEKAAWQGKSSLALGETSATAYRGDRGKVAYDHSQAAHAPVNVYTKAEADGKYLPIGGLSSSRPVFSYGQTTGIGNAANNLGGIVMTAAGSGAAFMAFHRPGVYAAYFGLDTDNQWAVGGWSAGAKRRLIAFQDQIPTSFPFPTGGITWNQLKGV